MCLERGTVRMLAWLVLPFVVTTLAACGTLEVGIEATATMERLETIASPATPGMVATPTMSDAPESTAAASSTPQEPKATTKPSSPTPTARDEGQPTTAGEVTATVTGVLPIGPFQPYENRETPYTLLASYYNAINREAYQDAFNYWRGLNQRLESFAGGFGETAGVLAAVHTPYYLEAAAGNRYASIPALVLAAQKDASQQTYVGCIVTWRAAEGVAEPSQMEWWLDGTTSLERADDTTGVSVLKGSCRAEGNAYPGFERRDDPVALIGAYYDAINRGEFERAYSYWQTPPEPYDVFAAGFADTADIYAITGLPFFQGPNGNADLIEVPVLLLATQQDGTQQNFVGCFYTRRTSTEAADSGSVWSLQAATLKPTVDNSTDMRQLVDACR